MTEEHRKIEILQDPDFRELARQKTVISVVLTLLTIVLYYGFVSLVAKWKDVLAAKASGGMTWGIPIGIAVILLAWILTGIYVWWANSKYDTLVERVREKVEH